MSLLLTSIHDTHCSCRVGGGTRFEPLLRSVFRQVKENPSDSADINIIPSVRLCRHQSVRSLSQHHHSIISSHVTGGSNPLDVLSIHLKHAAELLERESKPECSEPE